MLDAQRYMEDLLVSLRSAFGKRLAYVGLQGSYLRQEANENSDIDIMVVIDGLSVSDLDVYRDLIQSMGDYEKSCGFICSIADLAAWNPLEISNLLHGTKDYYGRLMDLVPRYTKKDIETFARLNLNNLYHEICHRYIHAGYEKNVKRLPSTYKSVFFILQTVEYLRSGIFYPTKAALLQVLSGRDKAVLETSMGKRKGISFQDAFEELFLWCQETLASL